MGLITENNYPLNKIYAHVSKKTTENNKVLNNCSDLFWEIYNCYELPSYLPRCALYLILACTCTMQFFLSLKNDA
jgi:hypothetical protein